MPQRISVRLTPPQPARVSRQTLHLAALRDAALSFTHHGWAVLPGSPWWQGRYRNPATSLVTAGLSPIWPREQASTEPRQVRAWWDTQPYSLLLVTGEAFDVISVPVGWGLAASQRPALRRHPAPVILTPAGRALFLVTPTARLYPQLCACPSANWSETTTVVPAPPTRMCGGPVTWWVTPERCDWQPGDTRLVQHALIDTTHAGAADHRTVIRLR
ncbi:DNA primase [Longimycelium tulufanense]|uniref:DNA primase n=1 Tax=Longimycelium tulufanense TaxID=907463 RepID=A0A8J3FW36_9PSEU|nr:bifunctional DNA primase/polymerase [Longimycelium tulufanense]GGM73706.1 DNA primase [Longimycelium tulufanense]